MLPLLFLHSILLTLSGCSFLSPFSEEDKNKEVVSEKSEEEKSEPEKSKETITELKGASSRSSNSPEIEILQGAKTYYHDGLYTLARESFLSLKESYPSSAYLEFAEIKAADASYEIADFVQAEKDYSSFIDNHPSSSSRQYALFRAGLSAESSSGGVGRDITPLERAVDYYDKCIASDEGSPFARASIKRRVKILDKLAKNEDFIARYYAKADITTASIKRAESAREVRGKLARAKRESEKVLEESSPRSNVKKISLKRLKAPSILQGRPVILSTTRKAAKDPRSQENYTLFASSQLDSLQRDELLELSGDKPLLGRVECVFEPTKVVLIELPQKLNDDYIKEHFHILANRDGVLRLSIPEVGAAPRNIDCFGSGDLVLASNGSLSLSNVKEAYLLALHYPPKLVISILSKSSNRR